MLRSSCHQSVLIFFFLIIGQNVLGERFVIKPDSIDSVRRSIYHLYEQTNSARSLLKEGETIACLKLCQQALEVYQNFPGSERYLGYILSYKAHCQRELGQLELSRISHLLVDWFAIKNNDKQLIRSNQINKYSLESDDGNYIKAGEVLLKQLKDIESKTNQDGKGIILNNLARNSLETGDLNNAKEYFDRLDCLIQSDQICDEFSEALFNRNYGYYYHVLGDLDSAQYYLEKALILYEKAHPRGHYQIAYSYNYLAKLFVDQGSLEKGLSSFQESLAIFQNDTTRKNLELYEMNRVSYETVYLSCVSSFIEFINSLLTDRNRLIDSMDLEQIYKLVQSAEDRINTFVFAQPTSSSVFTLTNKVRGLFDAGIQLALSLYRLTSENRYLDQAFEWSVRAKGYSIRVMAEKELQVLQEPELKSLFLERKRLMANIRVHSKSDAEFLTPSKVDSLMSWSRKLEEYADSLHFPTVKSLETIQSLSKHWNESLISYHVFDDSAVAFLLDNGKVKVEQLILPVGFRDSVSIFKSMIYCDRPGIYSNTDVMMYDQLGHHLYQILIKPLRSLSKSKDLIIQPDDYLLGLPFEMLIAKTSKGSKEVPSFRDLEYLTRKLQIAYWVGSGSNLRPEKRSSDKIMLIECPKNSNNSDSFGEVQYLKSLFLSHCGLGNLTDFGAIHIASHYYMNESQAMESGLVCSAESIDPYFKLWDLLLEDYSGAKVFINGCNTGSGKVYSGQGLMSMSLIFGLDGAEEVISHLWKAPDETSEAIALDFYENGIPKDYSKRLRKSKMNYLKLAPAGMDHPHFWGGLVCAAKPTKKVDWYYWLVLFVVFGGGVLFWTRK